MVAQNANPCPKWGLALRTTLPATTGERRGFMPPTSVDDVGGHLHARYQGDTKRSLPGALLVGKLSDPFDVRQRAQTVFQVGPQIPQAIACCLPDRVRGVLP